MALQMMPMTVMMTITIMIITTANNNSTIVEGKVILRRGHLLVAQVKDMLEIFSWQL